MSDNQRWKIGMTHTHVLLCLVLSPISRKWLVSPYDRWLAFRDRAAPLRLFASVPHGCGVPAGTGAPYWAGLARKIRPLLVQLIVCSQMKGKAGKVARLAHKYALEHEIRSGCSENRTEEVHIPHSAAQSSASQTWLWLRGMLAMWGFVYHHTKCLWGNVCVCVCAQVWLCVFTAILWTANNWFAPVHPLLCLLAWICMNILQILITGLPISGWNGKTPSL